MSVAIIVDIRQYYKVIYAYMDKQNLDVISNNGLQIIFEYHIKSKLLNQSRHIKNSKGVKIPDSRMPKDIRYGVIRFVMLSEYIAYVDHTSKKLKKIREYLTKNNINYINSVGSYKETDIEIRKRVLGDIINKHLPNVDHISSNPPLKELYSYNILEDVDQTKLIPVNVLSDWYPDLISKDYNQYHYLIEDFKQINKLVDRVIAAALIISAERDNVFKVKHGLVDYIPATIVVNINNTSTLNLIDNLILLLIKYYTDRLDVGLKVLL